MDVLYEVDVEAKNEEDAKSKVNAGDFDDNEACTSGEEMLGINPTTFQVMYGPVTYSTVNTCTISK